MGDETKDNITQCRDSQLIELLATSAWLNGLPTFKGERDDDIEEYFRRFEDQTIGLDDRLKTLAIRKSLVATAKEWLNGNCNELLESHDFDKIKSQLLERYCGQPSYIRNRQRLSQLKYDVNGRETLASFGDRYVALARRIEIKTDREILTGILLALPDDVMGDLEYLINIKDVTTVKEFMNVAHRYDSIASKRSKNLGCFSQLGAIANFKELEKTMNDLRGEFQKQQEQIIAAIGSKNQYQVNENRRCYNCATVGHLARNCLKPKAQGQALRPNEQSTDKDWTKLNQQAKETYEKKFGKPLKGCPICDGYHFVYHCPIKTLNE